VQQTIAKYEDHAEDKAEENAVPQNFTSTFAVFEFKVEPVVDVMEAVAVELKAIECRKKHAS
jgi:hypothetical protein